MTLEGLREKYPQYSDLSDDQLVSSFHKRFYSDIPLEQFQQKLGVKPPVVETPKPATTPAGGALDRLLAQTKAVGTEAAQFAVGAGRGLAGTGEFLANAATQGLGVSDRTLGIGNETRPRAQQIVQAGFNPLAESFKRTDQILNPEGNFDVAGYAGEVLNPVGLKTAKVAGLGKGVIDRTLRGAAVGGITGATQLGEDSIGMGAGIGAGLGGALAATSRFIGRPVAEMIKYFSPGGAERMANKYTNEIVGPENMPKIIAEINEQLGRQGTGTFVPGYKKTVGEMVSHMPEASPLQALQAATAKGPRGISAQFFQRADDQQGAIKQALRTVARTPEELDSAIASRGALATKEYGDAARKLKVDDELKSLLGDPYFQKIKKEALDMSVSSGQKDMTSFLQNAKSLLSTTAREAKDPKERMLVGNVERKLSDWLENANPDWAKARTNFRERSIPINQMQVGQQIEKKLLSPSDQMMPGGYLKAIADETATIKTATGQPRSEFGQVFTGQQKATLDEIGQLLEGKLASQKPLQATRLSGDNIAEDAVIHLPQLLSRPVAMANWAIKQITGAKGNLEARVDKVNAARMLDPAKFAAAMKTLPAGERRMIENALAAVKYQGVIAPAINALED
jgi:hypothetical protein